MRAPILTECTIAAAGKALLRDLDHATRQVENSQKTVLRSILSEASDTAFGKQHRISDRMSISEYRSSVNIQSHEDLETSVLRIRQGAADILFPGKPLRYIVAGPPVAYRWFPVSRRYYTAAIRHYNTLWLYSALRDNKSLLSGMWLTTCIPSVQITTGSPPCGSLGSTIFDAVPAALRRRHAVPLPIFTIEHSYARNYGIMRYALRNDISWIISPDANLLLRLHRSVLDNRDDILRDIHDGTLRTDIAAELDPHIRFSLVSRLRPDPSRAKILASVFATHDNRLQPKHYWPNIICISSWMRGKRAGATGQFMELYPKSAALREFGYQTSEARAGMVLGNNRADSIPLINKFFFEFIEVEKRYSTIPEIRLAHELEAGKSYYILVTNGSGLFRYDTNDIIRVTSFYNRCPQFEYVKRGELITHILDERLSEDQVARAVRQAAVETGLTPGYLKLFCDYPQKRYRLYAEIPETTPPHQKQHFILSFDAHLKFFNRIYAAGRATNGIFAPNLIELQPGSGRMLSELRIEEEPRPEKPMNTGYLHHDGSMMHIIDKHTKR